MHKFYDEIYARALDLAANARGYVFCGFTSNLDRVIDWDADLFSNLAHELSAKIPESPRTFVSTPLDLISDILWYCSTGRGGELEIRDGSLCEFIDGRFSCLSAIGGTGVQAAAALACAGVDVVCHLSDSSREVLNLLPWDNLRLLENGALLPAHSSTPSRLDPMRHYILQFDRGDTISFGGVRFTIPASNRVIITYDTLNEDLIVDSTYADYIARTQPDCLCALFSGLNCVTPISRILHRICELGALADCIDAPVFLEDAHYHISDHHWQVYTALVPRVDIMSMNEDEFSSAISAYAIPSPKSPRAFIDSAITLRKLMRPKKGLIVHTRDFALYTGDHSSLHPDLSLALGNAMGATRARLGRYGSFRDLCDTMSLPLSSIGLDWANLAKSYPDLTLIPSRALDRPACTVGLGDCFAGGCQVLLRG